MAFEWDEEKSRKTKRERGLDFNEASQLWGDLDSIEVPAFCETEPRWVKVGILNGQILAAIFTVRGKKKSHHKRASRASKGDVIL